VDGLVFRGLGSVLQRRLDERGRILTLAGDSASTSLVDPKLSSNLIHRQRQHNGNLRAVR